MIITTGPFKFRRPAPAFTLPEVMVALAIGTFLLTGATASIISLMQGSNSLINYVEMNNQSRHMLELFARDVRGTKEITLMTPSRVVLQTTGPNFTTEVVEYLYEPSAATFFRTANDGPRQVLLNNVEELELRYFNLRLGDATVPIEVKHIQVEAIMRQSALRVDNTNYIISAQFMLRNKSVAN